MTAGLRGGGRSGAPIVASCRSDSDAFVAVLLRFARFRRRPLVLGQFRAE